MLEKNPKDLTLDDLEKLYLESEQCDKRVFAEQRTNLQLCAGEHYVREGSRYWNRIRDNKQLTDEQRLKLTKNHIQRIVKGHINTFLSASPGVAVEPKEEKNLHHQKTAELNYSVVRDWHDRYGFGEKIEEWTFNFFEIGELAVKVFWENEDGHVMGYEAKEEGGDEVAQPENDDESEPSEPGTENESGDPIDEESAEELVEGLGDLEGEGQENPMNVDENVDDNKPVYSGCTKFETIFGYNLKRDPDSASMDESPYLLITKMTSLSAVRARTDEDTFKSLKQSNTYEYTVFDNNTGSYRNSKNQLLLKEIYFRPNPKLHKGYFFIFTSNQILTKGELPYGLFPIIYEGCEKQTGNARAHSPIRHIRPCQIELNRCASKVAETQVTIGDDKVFINSTTKVSQGAFLPGVRVNTYSGMNAPLVIPGRTGEQYIPYMEQTIDEMYKLAEMEELNQDVPPETDIYTQLYRSLKQKKKFVIYSDKLERFLCKAVDLGLRITKCSIPDEALIPAIGKNEYINVAEFKSQDDLSHTIKVKPRSDDVETQMGKQLVINHFLQYAGSNISRQDIGMAMRMSPFTNKEEMFRDFTLDYDNITNDILALDRGTWRPPRKQDDPKYVVKKLESRTAQADFEFLPPHVQQMYAKKIQMHEQILAQQAQQLQQAEAGFIPSGGYLVACDFYVQEPGGDPNKTRRVRIPSESVSWLIDKLQSQGNQLADLTDQSPGVQSDLSMMLRKPPLTPQPGGMRNLAAGHAMPGPALRAPQPMGRPVASQPLGVPNARPGIGTIQQPNIQRLATLFGRR